jgi:hypothetical protein
LSRQGEPLRRIVLGDRVAYYSPTVTFGGKDRLQAFTAIGAARERAPDQADMGRRFQSLRRDVDWWPCDETPIKPLLCNLAFAAGKSNWSCQLRFGLFSTRQQIWILLRSRCEH